MEEHRFDHLARILSRAGSRRGVLGRLATLSLVGVLIASSGEDGLGARHRRRRKARHDPGQDKDNRKGKRRRKRKGKPSRCTPDCAGKVCGSDGCDGSCAPGCNDATLTCNVEGQCVPRSCADGVRNDDETGVDCGGSCPPCPGQACLSAADCQPPATCNMTIQRCETTCEITAECLTIAAAAGLPVRCCNGTCVAGTCCSNADCSGTSGTTPTCVNNVCRLCSPTTPGCAGA
jgi:hypothetical protein